MVTPFVYRDEYLAKIARRVKEYQIKVLNEPRDGKKLLVLDVDYTLFGTMKHIRVDNCIFHNLVKISIHKSNLGLIIHYQ